MQKNVMLIIGIDVLQVLSKIKADICFMGAGSINIKKKLKTNRIISFYI